MPFWAENHCLAFLADNLRSGVGLPRDDEESQRPAIYCAVEVANPGMVCLGNLGCSLPPAGRADQIRCRSITGDHAGNMVRHGRIANQRSTGRYGLLPIKVTHHPKIIPRDWHPRGSNSHVNKQSRVNIVKWKHLLRNI